MSDKPKFPRSEAIAAAREILALLPADRVIVAGSLRRRRPLVGDIEILYIPKIHHCQDPAELLPRTVETNVSDIFIEDVLIRAKRMIRRRENVIGRTTWGPSNKLAVHVRSGIPVDFFATSESAWYNYLVCRTGGAENNVRIASAAQKKGWTWHPYAKGFTDDQGRVVTVKSERDVFDLVNLPYLEPWERS